MAACDRTYPRYYCKANSLWGESKCAILWAGSGPAKLDHKAVDYIDEISGTVCSTQIVEKCACNVG